MNKSKVKRPAAKRKVKKVVKKVIKQVTHNNDCVNFLTQRVSKNGCYVSCGIGEINNVANAYRSAISSKNWSKEVVTKSLEYLLKNLNNHKAINLVSLNDKADKTLIKLMDSMTEIQSPWRLNTNSRNNIKIWTL